MEINENKLIVCVQGRGDLKSKENCNLMGHDFSHAISMESPFPGMRRPWKTRHRLLLLMNTSLDVMGLLISEHCCAINAL